MDDDETRDLVRTLTAHRWREGTALTQRHLQRTDFDAAVIQRIDEVWRACSEGRFGFTAQIGAAGRPPPGPEVPSEEWAYATLVGKAVGWHREGNWSRWRDVKWGSSYGSLVDTMGAPVHFPVGCFPFHDALTDADWVREFSPRDAWGEATWSSWCRVWRAVIAGAQS